MESTQRACQKSLPNHFFDEQCWLTREVPVDWAPVMPIFRGWKYDLGNYRPFSLISVPGKVMEQLILCATMWHMQDSQEIRHNQCGFMKSRSFLIFCDKVTCSWRRERLWVLSTGTSAKPLMLLPTAFFWRNSPPWLGRAHCLLGKNWLYVQAQSGGEWSYIQLMAGHKWCSPGLSTGAGSV